MRTTLDEWEILQTVVQLGGFAPAAKQLNRSQSTISYAIARLQEQLGIKLFEIKERRAHLTEFGRALLADVARLFPYVQPKLRQSTFLSADSEFSVHNAQLCITGLISREFFTKPIL